MKDRHSSVLYRDEEEGVEIDEVDEEELVFSAVGLMSLWECFRSVPGQPRLAAVVLLVSTMLMERWPRKPDFPHWLELASWEGRGLSDCCPHSVEVRNRPSEGSAGRRERDERENDVLLRG